MQLTNDGIANYNAPPLIIDDAPQNERKILISFLKLNQILIIFSSILLTIIVAIIITVNIIKKGQDDNDDVKIVIHHLIMINLI